MNILSSLSSHCGNARRRRCISGFTAIVAIASNYTFATEPSSAHRFELYGAGILMLDAPSQRSSTLHLKATLSPGSVSPGSISMERPALQTGIGLALAATLVPLSLVCYSDTIFRDDFDGDGF